MLRFLLATYGREQLSSDGVDPVTLPAAVHEIVDCRLHELGVEARGVLEMGLADEFMAICRADPHR